MLAIEGVVNSVSRMHIHGWAADPVHPDLVIDVVIFVNGTQAGRVRAAEPSEGLRKLGKFGAGNHVFNFAFDPPLPHDRRHEIRVLPARRTEPLSRGEIVLDAVPEASMARSIDAAVATELRPIFVTFTYRSGSTMLMSMLGSHPEVVVGNIYPMEIEVASHYAKALGVLGRLNNGRRTTPIPPDLVGPSPFSTVHFQRAFGSPEMFSYYFQSKVPAELKRCFSALTTEFYRCLAADQGKRPRFFAEKLNILPRSLRQGVLGMFAGNACEILLVRDLRDVYGSRLKFHGALMGRDINTGVMKSLRDSAAHLVSLARSGAAEQALLVRYEDMVRDPEAVFRKVVAHVGAGAADGAIELNPQLFARHATSASPAASIGRWKSDLSDEQKEFCQAEFGEFLTTFGYA
jgi:hypothetical protein